MSGGFEIVNPESVQRMRVFQRMSGTEGLVFYVSIVDPGLKTKGLSLLFER